MFSFNSTLKYPQKLILNPSFYKKTTFEHGFRVPRLTHLVWGINQLILLKVKHIWSFLLKVLFYYYKPQPLFGPSKIYPQGALHKNKIMHSQIWRQNYKITSKFKAIFFLLYYQTLCMCHLYLLHVGKKE